MCSVRKLRLRELKKHAQGHTAVEARHGVGAQSCLTSEPTHFPPFGPVGFGVSSRLWGDSDPQNIRVRSPHKEADPEKISPIPITATGKGDISIRMKLRISHLFFFFLFSPQNQNKTSVDEIHRPVRYESAFATTLDFKR